MAFTWSGGTFSSAGFVWPDVRWSASLGMYVTMNGGGGTGTDRIATSTDGSSWTTRTTPDQSTSGLSWDETGAKSIVGGTNALMELGNPQYWSKREVQGDEIMRLRPDTILCVPQTDEALGIRHLKEGIWKETCKKSANVVDKT